MGPHLLERMCHAAGEGGEGEERTSHPMLDNAARRWFRAFVRGVARFISIVGHPFVFIPAAIVFHGVFQPDARRPTPATSASILPIVGIVLLGMFAIGGYVGYGLRKGRWADVDVSVREQRGGLYAVSLIATAAATLAFHVFGPPIGVRGSLIAFLLVLLSAVVNLRLKISLHVGFAAYAVGIACGRRLDVLVVAAAWALAIAWSRVVLKRHTLSEVVAGAIAGTLAGAAFALG